jgi:hypothetical protein
MLPHSAAMRLHRKVAFCVSVLLVTFGGDDDSTPALAKGEGRVTIVYQYDIRAPQTPMCAGSNCNWMSKGSAKAKRNADSLHRSNGYLRLRAAPGPSMRSNALPPGSPFPGTLDAYAGLKFVGYKL